MHLILRLLAKQVNIVDIDENKIDRDSVHWLMEEQLTDRAPPGFPQGFCPQENTRLAFGTWPGLEQ